MPMTHYMELLAQNQPWNLILFMAIPVILAETVAITELFILLLRSRGGWLRALNRFGQYPRRCVFPGGIRLPPAQRRRAAHPHRPVARHDRHDRRRFLSLWCDPLGRARAP